jgi:hypothetical protein
MYVDVLDVHTQVLQWFFRPDLSEPDKLPGNAYGTNLSVEQQMVKLHQAVHLLVVDDVSSVFQLIPYVLISIATELLLQDSFHILDYYHIINKFTFLCNRHLAWLAATHTSTPFVVKAAARHAGPRQ